MFPCKIQLVLIVLVSATRGQCQSLECQTLKSEMNAKLEDIRTSIQVQLDSIRSENTELIRKLQALETRCQLHDKSSVSELDANNTVGDYVKTASGTFSSNMGIARIPKNRDYPHTRAGGVHEHIAFYAYLSDDVVNPQTDRIIYFNYIITNLGGAYSRYKGVFRCPKAGVYFFTWSITTVLHGQVDTIMRKNGGNVEATVTASKDDTENRGASNSAILELAPGDEIDIIVGYIYGDVTFRNLFTSFSGFLMAN